MVVERDVSPHRGRLRQLEAARGFAAMYVFVHHYTARTGVDIKYVLSFSTAAVMLFFLLSGFVIYLSSGFGERDFAVRGYARKRLLRIFPPYLVALALAYVVACLLAESTVPVNPDGLLRNMLFLIGDDRVHGVFAYKHNAPLWSLSYEVWFYVFFAVIVVAAGRSFDKLRRYAMAVSLVGFVTVWLIPNPVSEYAVLFVIWWAGAEMAREYEQTRDVTLRGQWIGLAGMAGMGALVALRIVVERAGGVTYPRTDLTRLALAFGIVVASILWHRMGMWGFRYTIGLFMIFAPISYGIYLFHYPIILLATSPQFAGASFVAAFWAIPAVLAFSWVFDLQLHRFVVRRWPRRVAG